ncbi:hypothetical protein NQZ68_020054, partial [Dissostichus eleginoides]
QPDRFLDFLLLSIPVTKEEDAQIPRWSSSTWLEVGREMTPQLDTVARSLISEPPLTPPSPPILEPAAIAALLS